MGHRGLPGAYKGFQTSFDTEAAAEVVRRVHALGGQVAIHAVDDNTIGGAIEAGVDSIEHGLMVRSHQMDEMAKEGNPSGHSGPNLTRAGMALRGSDQ